MVKNQVVPYLYILFPLDFVKVPPCQGGPFKQNSVRAGLLEIGPHSLIYISLIYRWRLRPLYITATCSVLVDVICAAFFPPSVLGEDF